MARDQLHERWRRRQFYLDEEEGGTAPEDWSEDEDIIYNSVREADAYQNGGPSSMPLRRHSGDWPSYTTPSGHLTNGKGIYESDNAIEDDSATDTSVEDDPELDELENIFRDEDAGREILYQVTQQAFNELLDTIFKPSEDLAIQSAETKAKRRKYKDLIAEIDDAELAEDKENEEVHQNGGVVESDIASKSLEELLDDAGYQVDGGAGRNAVEIAPEVEPVFADEEDATKTDTVQPPAEYRDLTMPQFRPNTTDSLPSHDQPQVNGTLAGKPAEPATPSRKDLIKWKRLELAEDQARQRGGWGKLDFAEFEEIYKRQEKQGNRLDYLGSWIEFCIP